MSPDSRKVRKHGVTRGTCWTTWHHAISGNGNGFWTTGKGRAAAGLYPEWNFQETELPVTPEEGCRYSPEFISNTVARPKVIVRGLEYWGDVPAAQSSGLCHQCYADHVRLTQFRSDPIQHDVLPIAADSVIILTPAHVYLLGRAHQG